ncbi:MAG: bifunctional phosphoribosylaminoimidazolecarboxamide formyltransferase/IMP cyclohydrolase [Oligoflexia bacterium]|nr:bifunctional phosphoribosylaminoimidazolecarboxamide formyltransferase/IMP cyclohydrolase [Oligoflexia bacterium]
MNIKIKRALLSVSDKTQLLELYQTLSKDHVEVYCSDGTYHYLSPHNEHSNLHPISELTQEKPLLEGRVKTLSSKIAAALLFDPQNPAHQKDAQEHNIIPIELVVCNLYPFESEESSDLTTLIEKIDIGGVTLIRAAAKNFQNVCVLIDPEDYALITSSEVNEKTREYLMLKAWNRIADYDSAIAVRMGKLHGQHSIRLSYHEGEPLRSGENPHQEATLYYHGHRHNQTPMPVLYGEKKLSYNNILDIDSSWGLLCKLSRLFPATQAIATIVKHTNPCGSAIASNLKTAIDLSLAYDSVSAFGGILSINQALTLPLFMRLYEHFWEIIIAPKIDPTILAFLSNSPKRKNLRLIQKSLTSPSPNFEGRFNSETLLLQSKSDLLYQDLPKESISPAILHFGTSLAETAKSNAIIAVTQNEQGDLYMVGHGQGQTNRVQSVQDALSNIEKLSATEIANTYIISDGFFPFSDSVSLIAKYGIKHIVQPGGSIRDKEIFEKCKELGIHMTFTNVRLFKH